MLAGSLLPILAWFLTGFALRRFGVAGAVEAAFLFRFILFVTLPALVFQTISQATLTRDLLLLPVAGLVVNLVCMSVAILYARRAALAPRAAGVLVLGAAVTNGVFHFAFVLTALGPAALAESILVDLGNAVFVATFAYAAASWFGRRDGAPVAASVRKTLRSPLFIALVAALAFSAGDVDTPALAGRILAPLGETTVPLTVVALGLSFSGAALRDRLALRTVLLRMPVGFATGLVLVWLLGFSGTTAIVVLVAAAAPIGFSSVTLASAAGLDTEQAVAALSLSVGVGLVTTTLLLAAGQHWFA